MLIGCSGMIAACNTGGLPLDNADSGVEDASLNCQQPFTACGGSPLGTWRSLGSCPPLPPLGYPDCPDATFSGTPFPTITFTFNSDSTYLGTQSMTDWTMTLPHTCIPMVTSCMQLSPSLGECTGDASVSCACKQVFESEEVHGTFSILDTILTLNQAGAPDIRGYCVKGNTLILDDVEAADVAANLEQATTHYTVFVRE